MSTERVLVAGVGNIQMGDDAFGVYAIRALEERGLSDAVRVASFGARSQDLAAEIKNGYDAVILVEAAAQEGTPGTLYVFDPDVEPVEAGKAIFGSRCMTPVDALRVLDAFDGYDGQIYIVGCEPASFEAGDPLSDPVKCALPEVVSLLETLLVDLLKTNITEQVVSTNAEQEIDLPVSFSTDIEVEPAAA